MPNKQAKTVTIALMKIFGAMGIPETIISDQGKEFINQSIRAAYDYMGITRKSSSPYHPQTNGLTERFNRTLKDIVAKICMTTDIPWDDALEWVMGNYRATPQKSTGDSPFFLEKGRDPFFPLDWIKNTSEKDFGRNVDIDAHPIENKPLFLEQMELIARDCREALEKSQIEAKERFDQRLKVPEKIQVGDWVKIEEHATGAGSKLKYRHTGPYRVVGEGRGPDTFRIMMQRSKTQVWNRAKLHRYFQRIPRQRM